VAQQQQFQGHRDGVVGIVRILERASLCFVQGVFVEPVGPDRTGLGFAARREDFRSHRRNRLHWRSCRACGGTSLNACFL